MPAAISQIVFVSFPDIDFETDIVFQECFKKKSYNAWNLINIHPLQFECFMIDLNVENYIKAFHGRINLYIVVEMCFHRTQQER